MTYELRTYTATDGRMDDLLRRFREHTLALFEQHGMTSVGYWTTPSDPNVLVYLLRHDGSPRENWAAFTADPAWVRAKAASVANGEIVESIESVMLEPTDVSALQN